MISGLEAAGPVSSKAAAVTASGQLLFEDNADYGTGGILQGAQRIYNVFPFLYMRPAAP